MAINLRVNRIFGIIGALFIILALCFGLYQYKRERDYRIDIMNSQLQMYNYQMAYTLGLQSLMSSDSVCAYVEAHRILGMRITIIDTLGVVVADSQQPDLSRMENHLGRTEVQDALREGKGYNIKRHSESIDQTYFYSASSLSVGGQRIIIRAAVPYSSELAQSLKYNDTFVYYAVIVVLLLGFVSHSLMVYYLRMRNAENDRERIKRQLTQNAAHELKTPAASIQGFLETIIQNPDLDADRRNHFIERCYEQSKRMSKLLADMNTLTKLDSHSRISTTEASVTVRSVVDSVLDDTMLQLRSRNITPIVEVSEALMLHKVDPALIYGLFRNLVDNAILYATNASYIRIYAERSDGRINFEFSDNGVGVSPDNLPLIFERFYREDKGRSRKLGGTGLGLAIVKNTVTYYGGEIEAAPNDGGGLMVRWWMR